MIKEYQIIIAGLIIALVLYFGLKEMKPDPQLTALEECVRVMEGEVYKNKRLSFEKAQKLCLFGEIPPEGEAAFPF